MVGRKVLLGLVLDLVRFLGWRDLISVSSSGAFWCCGSGGFDDDLGCIFRCLFDW